MSSYNDKSEIINNYLVFYIRNKDKIVIAKLLVDISKLYKVEFIYGVCDKNNTEIPEGLSFAKQTYKNVTNIAFILAETTIGSSQERTIIDKMKLKMIEDESIKQWLYYGKLVDISNYFNGATVLRFTYNGNKKDDRRVVNVNVIGRWINEDERIKIIRDTNKVILENNGITMSVLGTAVDKYKAWAGLIENNFKQVFIKLEAYNVVENITKYANIKYLNRLYLDVNDSDNIKHDSWNRYTALTEDFHYYMTTENSILTMEFSLDYLLNKLDKCILNITKQQMKELSTIQAKFVLLNRDYMIDFFVDKDFNLKEWTIKHD